MSAAKRCDRCRKFYEPYLKGPDVLPHTNEIILAHSDACMDKNHRRSFDLCRDCVKDLAKFLLIDKKED